MDKQTIYGICAITAISLVPPRPAKADEPPVVVNYEVRRLVPPNPQIPLEQSHASELLKPGVLDRARQQEIEFSNADKSCKLKLKLSTPVGSNAPQLVIKGDKNHCTELWLQKDPKEILFPSGSDENSSLFKKSLRLEPKVPSIIKKAPLTKMTGNVFRCNVCTNSQQTYSVYYYENGWQERGLDPGKNGFDIPNRLGLDNASEALEGFTNFGENGEEGYFKFTINPADVSPEGPPETPPDCSSVKKFPNFCKATLDPKVDLICVDLVTQGEKPAVRFSSEMRHILRPNRSVLVKVRHLAKLEVNLEMQGNPGLFEPTIRSQVPTTDEAQAAPGCDPKERVTEATFGPRLPGKADIVIKTKVANDPSAKENVHTIELFVERTYFGAIRLGVASVFAGAVDAEYEARTVGGSGQAEVAAKTSGPMNAELVLGFSPYLFDYIARSGEGRPEVTPRATGFAPYFGIGLLNANGTGLELLKSIHLGLEYEFIPSFSLAATGVLRRVTRLAPGVEVGSAVSGSVPTTTGYGFGAGLVLNFSPEFLRLAAQSSSGFFK